MIVFGPVPSRRLGHSLGINHIPLKHCTYSCVYCQVGRTTTLETTRRSFFPLDQIIKEVERKISESTKLAVPIDYLTLVPDGEPTLDIKFRKLIEGLANFGIPVAVISNASLVDREEVQDALLLADWVSMKVDAVIETEWRRINRPHRSLSLSSVLNGIIEFHRKFHGELVTETMLVSGLNDSDAAIQALSDFLLKLNPNKSYLSLPIRPPAEKWVKPPAPEILQHILDAMSERVSFLELMFESESSDFISTGNIIEDILTTTAVHPLREEALRNMITHSGEKWMIIDELLDSKRITNINYRGEKFYLNNLSNLIMGAGGK